LAPHQRKEESQSLSIVGGGIELDSGGKQSRSTQESKFSSLAFSRSSCSVSFSICFVLSSLSSMSFLSCYGFAGLRLHPLLVLNPALLVVQH